MQVQQEEQEVQEQKVQLTLTISPEQYWDHSIQFTSTSTNTNHKPIHRVLVQIYKVRYSFPREYATRCSYGFYKSIPDRNTCAFNLPYIKNEDGYLRDSIYQFYWVHHPR